MKNFLDFLLSFPDVAISYLNRSFPEYALPVERRRSYISLAILITLVVAATELSKPEICPVLPYLFIHDIIVYGGSIMVMSEWIFPLVFPQWGSLSKRTPTSILIIFFAGVLAGYGVDWSVRIFLQSGELVQLDPLMAFTQVLPLAGLVAFVMMVMIGKRNLVYEVDRIERLNRQLIKKRILDKQEKISNQSIGHLEVSNEMPLLISDGVKKTKLFPSRISHILVEDHYSRFFYSTDKGLEEIFTRMSLAEALEVIKSDHFLQIHRSYAINLNHVSYIEKIKRSYQIGMEKGPILPISRYRIQNVLPPIEAFLKVPPTQCKVGTT